ncbi:DedA family protein [Anaerolentibacter hominis]|uniref:DedA family protein n=1 Tax=Anaerolentibacter hominis TaxID=3079009 RepID=UPI0031B8747C
MSQYGAIAVFVIVLLEYMNLPGFPAGIIMPLAGIWASQGGISFPMTILLSVAAGLLGSWILYGVGRIGGELFLDKFLRKFPKQEPAIRKNLAILQEKGSWGVFVSKLVPMLRTLISIPAGVLKMNFMKYSISSALGVFVWNLFFVGAGYFLGDAAFRLLKLK